jgi:RNA polymerase sigma-70 factor (ECF subfamily)
MGAALAKSSASDDAALVQLALLGDQRAFQGLVERHQERLFRLVRHYARSSAEVEDVVQDTFLKAFRRLESFQHQSSFATWIARIAVNTALDSAKRRARSPVHTVEEIEESAGPERSVNAPDARLEREEVARITQDVLEHLPDIFRTVLVLREFEGMAYQDIADLLSISIGTVESRLFRARARFKERLIALHPEFASEAERRATGPGEREPQRARSRHEPRSQSNPGREEDEQP